MAGRIDRRAAEDLLLDFDDLHQIESMLEDDIAPESLEIGLGNER